VAPGHTLGARHPCRDANGGLTSSGLAGVRPFSSLNRNLRRRLLALKLPPAASACPVKLRQLVEPPCQLSSQPGALSALRHSIVRLLQLQLQLLLLLPKAQAVPSEQQGEISGPTLCFGHSYR